MNPSYQRTTFAKSPLWSSMVEPSDPINIEEPMDFNTTQRLRVALERQLNSRELSSHFRTSNISDIISSKVDHFLRDQLFEQRKSPTKHKRAETNFLGRFVTKNNRQANQNSRDSSELSSPEPALRAPESKAEAKQKAIQNLQLYLTKSYENYRSNFYATTDRPKPAPVVVATPVPPSTPVAAPSLNVARKLFPSTFAKQVAKRKEERKEEACCQFIDFYASAPRVESRPQSNDELKDNARACRFFKITVSANQPKEAKPSVSTQCSGSSIFQIN